MAQTRGNSELQVFPLGTPENPGKIPESLGIRASSEPSSNAQPDPQGAPGGRETPVGVLHSVRTGPSKRYVVGFLFTSDESEVVLLRKNRPAWQAGKLNGMGGHVEPGESYAAAMDREAAEECAGGPFGWELFAVLGSTDHPKGTNETWEMACFRATAMPWFEMPPTNDVGEIFERAYPQDVAAGAVTTIPNLAWLVPMALRDRPNWPYRLTERAVAPAPPQIATQLLDSLLAVEWAGDAGDSDCCPNCGAIGGPDSDVFDGLHTPGCELRDSLDAALGIRSPRSPLPQPGA